MTELSNKQKEYFLEVLRLNPVYQTDEILLARNTILEADSYDVRSKRQLASREYADRKAEARKQIGDLREVIWTSNLDEVEAMLKSLDISEFPEYQKDAKTFQIIIETREKLPHLSTDKKYSADFFECVKQSLVASPTERAEIEERVRASFTNKQLKRDAKRMVTLIETHLPELYNIRKDWFDNMFSKRGQYPLS